MLTCGRELGGGRDLFLLRRQRPSPSTMLRMIPRPVTGEDEGAAGQRKLKLTLTRSPLPVWGITSWRSQLSQR